MDPTQEISESDRTALVEQWTQLAHAVCRHFCNSRELPPDLVQEAKLALVRASRSFDPALGPFGPFAALVIERSLRRFLTKNIMRGHRINAGPDDFAKAGPTEAEDRAYRQDLAGMVLASLDALTAPQQDLLIRRFGLEGDEPESYVTIGRELGISADQARDRTLGALTRVRAHFHAQGWTYDTWALAIA